MEKVDMKKVSLFILVCILVQNFILPVGVSAETPTYDYQIEGESFVNSNWICNVGNIANASTCSGGKFARVFTQQAPSEGCYYADYTVNVTDAGTYDLYAKMTSVLNGNGASSASIQVNNGIEYKLTGEIMDNNVDNSMYLQSLDSVYLNPGLNTIRLLTRAPRTTDNYYTLFVDFLGLKKSSQKIRNITTEAPFAVFEADDTIRLIVNSNAPVLNDTSVSWHITNVYGTVVDSGTSIILAGNKTVDIVAEKLGLGYYEITADGLTTGFSVVKPLSDRTVYPDTPFAVDTNFNSSVVGHLHSEYAKVLALSGVSWIRERVHFNQITTYNNGSYVFNKAALQETAKQVKPYGIKVSVAADYMPSELIDGYSNYIPVDLNKTYSFWKQVGENFDGIVDNWEIFNEVDLGGTTSSSDSPDVYAAYMKAAAVGLADAKTENEVTASTQGAAARMNSESEYLELLMKNDILDYSVCDNTHEHRSIDNIDGGYYPFAGTDNIKAHIQEQTKQDEQAPIWVTEAGIAIKTPSDRNFTLSEQLQQAKYLVTSTVESIASGTDKHFFFIGPNYREGDIAWGMTSNGQLNPYMYAALPAQAAMTDLLGKGIYLGKVDQLPNDICGYAFDSGTDTVLVIWSTNGQKNLSISHDEASSGVYDVFGNLITSNVSELQTLNEEPIYIKVDSSYDKIISDRRGMLSVSEKNFTDPKKIILTQKYSDTARGGARTDGYSVSPGDNRVEVVVSNLTQNAINGTVYGSFENGWTLAEDNKAVTVPAGSSASVFFEIDSFANSKDYLRFYGEFDGGETSASTAMVKTGNDHIITVEAENYANKSTVFKTYKNGLYLFATAKNDYIIDINFSAQEAGKYNMWTLAGLLGYDWSSDFDIFINGNEAVPVNKTNRSVEYWYEHSAVGYNQFEPVELRMGLNTIRFVVNKNRNHGDEYYISALDKVVFIKSNHEYNWIEAENYSQRSGSYSSDFNYSATNGMVMNLFTYGIDNPETNNILGYDFYLNDNDRYDIWVLSSPANVSYTTKWKWALNSNNYLLPDYQQIIQSNYTELNVPLYWHKLGSNVSLKYGKNNISFLSDTKREAGDYMLNVFDAIVIVKTGTWMPTANVQDDKIKYVASNMFSDIDLGNVTGNIVLPKRIGNDIVVTWTSSDPDIVSPDGTVVRPVYGNGNKNVTLTATYKCGVYETIETYEVNVIESDILLRTSLFDEFGNKITKFKENAVIKMDFANDSNEEMNLTVYSAVYDKYIGKLLSVTCEEKTIAANTADTCELKIGIANNNLQRNMVKTFVWRDNMTPIDISTNYIAEDDVLNAPVHIDHYLYVSGKTQNGNERLAISIFSEQIGDSSSVSEIMEKLIHFTELSTDADGNYSCKIKLNKESEKYYIKIGGVLTGTVDNVSG